MIIINPGVAKKATLTPEQQSLVRPWLSFCQDDRLRLKSVIIEHSNVRNIGRWGAKKRARPFVILWAQNLEYLSSAKTFEGAFEIAQRLNAGLNP